MATKSLGELPSKPSRGCPNGGTRPLVREGTPKGEASGGTETSQYPEENKSSEIPLVVANERGRAQTLPAQWAVDLSRSGVVRYGGGGDRPLEETQTDP